jgi:putative membrane protein
LHDGSREDWRGTMKPEDVLVDVRSNDTLANERTYLAYVRTALAFVAFGFVIARFSLFAREFSTLVHVSSPHSTEGVSTAFGTGMALFGILVAMLGAWRYAVTDRGLRHGRVITLSAVTAYAVSLFIVAVGAVVAFALLSYR